MIPEFPKAAYYDCCDSDQLEHETPEEAVEYLIEQAVDHKDEPVLDTIRSVSPVTVTAYERHAVTDEWINRIAGSAVEQAADSWEEEYGNPDGAAVSFSPKAVAAAEVAMARVLREFWSSVDVWVCDPIEPLVVLDAAQVEEMMRAYNPEWFEPAALTDAKGVA